MITDEPLTLHLTVPFTDDPDPDSPPLWWIRPDVPDAWLHRLGATRGQTACGQRLNTHFRPATSTELARHKKCRRCVPRPSHSPRRAVRPS